MQLKINHIRILKLIGNEMMLLNNVNFISISIDGKQIFRDIRDVQTKIDINIDTYKNEDSK